MAACDESKGFTGANAIVVAATYLAGECHSAHQAGGSLDFVTAVALPPSPLSSAACLSTRAIFSFGAFAKREKESFWPRNLILITQINSDNTN